MNCEDVTIALGFGCRQGIKLKLLIVINLTVVIILRLVQKKIDQHDIWRTNIKQH